MQRWYVVNGNGTTHTYNHFDCNPGRFVLTIDTDLDVGPFFTDDPNSAIPEARRYLLHEWGRNSHVTWKWEQYAHRDREVDFKPCGLPKHTYDHWKQMLLAQNVDGKSYLKHITRVVVGGEHYHIIDEPETPYAFRGFGGRPFLIKFFDGTLIPTKNLWHNGTIPEVYRPFFPDNATFVEV